MGQPWQAEPDADGEEARALRPLVVPHGPEVPEQATDAAVAAECEVQTSQARPLRFRWARLPLRLQTERPVVEGVERTNRCLADFVAPKSGPGAKPDGIGLFAVTAGLGVEKKERQFIADRDDCSAILLKALAVRLAMTPAASVSGFCLAHPDATCFNVGRIGEDLVADWARRMAMDEAQSRRGLAGVV